MTRSFYISQKNKRILYFHAHHSQKQKKSIKISTAFSGVGYTLTANAGEKRREKWGASNLTTACAPLTGGGILFGGIPPGEAVQKGDRHIDTAPYYYLTSLSCSFSLNIFFSMFLITSINTSSVFPVGSSRPQSSLYLQGKYGQFTLHPIVITTSTGGISDKSLLRCVFPYQYHRAVS